MKVIYTTENDTNTKDILDINNLAKNLLYTDTIKISPNVKDEVISTLENLLKSLKNSKDLLLD